MLAKQRRDMHALTVKQPHAELIVCGQKTYRGPDLEAAGAAPDAGGDPRREAGG